MGGRITLSTTDEAEALYNELETDIENLYGGKSAFWRTQLMNFDDKARKEAKIEMIEQQIEYHQNQIEDLKLQKKGIESELEDIRAEETEEKIDKEVDVDEKFWDTTMRKIFERNNSSEPAKVEHRWDQWFDGRHKLFVNKYYEIPSREFKKMILEKAENRGYEEKVEKIK